MSDPYDHTLMRYEAENRRLREELVQIRVALGRVSVFEGLTDVSPVALMVAQLAEDHEALETRIEAVLHYISAITEEAPGHPVSAETIVAMLRGDSLFPDNPGELT